MYLGTFGFGIGFAPNPTHQQRPPRSKQKGRQGPENAAAS